MNLSEKTQSFLYQPLQREDSFRLLDLRHSPSSPTWEGNLIEERLSSNHSSTNAPKYVALSYAWGDPTFSVPNQDCIELSFSVSIALAHVLELEAGGNELTIWVDQFCINQRNKQEREQQVAMMGRIYAGAERVIGWLGPAFEGSELALDDLTMFAGVRDDAPEEENYFLQVLRSRLAEHPPLGDPREIFLSYLQQVMLLGSDLRARMICLFDLPWFRRRWIAQEACLASNLRVHCGYRSISGDQLFRAISAIGMIVVYGPAPWLQRPFRNAFALLQTRNTVQDAVRGECRLSFLHIVHNLSFLDCKKDQDQDRINALYGIVESNSSSMEKATAYGYLAEHVCRYRTLFVGDDGAVGLGSAGIGPGDRVCFFYGLDAPFIVHPKGDNFELRGECYLDGFMDIRFDELEAVEREIVLQ